MTKPSKQINKTKRTATAALLVASILIVVSGLFFGIYCTVNGISYRVLNTDIPGLIFGLVAAFLGARYIKATLKLKKKLNESKESFNWSNFKFSNSK